MTYLCHLTMSICYLLIHDSLSLRYHIMFHLFPSCVEAIISLPVLMVLSLSVEVKPPCSPALKCWTSKWSFHLDEGYMIFSLLPTIVFHSWIPSVIPCAFPLFHHWFIFMIHIFFLSKVDQLSLSISISHCSPLSELTEFHSMFQA